MDGFAYNFRVVVLEDCSAAHKADIHAAFLTVMRMMPLDPLVRIMGRHAPLEELAGLPERV
jgi:hypothetical protein